MKLLGIIAFGTACAVASAGYTYVNAQSGDPQMGRKALNFGITQTMGVYGEAANLPANFVEEVKPGLTRLSQQGGALLNSTAPARTDQVDPSQQAPAPAQP